VAAADETVLVQRANACWENGRIGRSGAGLIEARQILAEARSAGDLRAMAEANRCIGWFCLQLGYCDEGLAAANEARNFYAGRDEHWGHALSLAVYSWLLAEVGLSDLCFDSATEAAVIAARTDDKALNAFAMNCKAVSLVLCQELKLALSLLDEAMRLADQSGDLSTVALSHINRGYAKHFLRQQVQSVDARLADALAQSTVEECRLGAEVARAAGDLWNLRVALANCAEAYAEIGDIERARACIEEYEDLPHELGPRERFHFLYSKSDIFLKLGRYDEVLPLLLEAYEVLASTGHHDHKANILRRLAELKARTGNFQEAYEYHRAYHGAYIADSGERSRRRAHALDRQLENDKLRERAAVLEAQAGEDALTGIPNRRAFDQAFEAVSHDNAAVGILDIDYFKQVNDQHSHLVGDAVLVRVARLLDGFHPRMRAFRIGGEEFGLIFDDMSLESAQPICQSIVDTVRSTPFDDIVEGMRVTVSIGVAQTGMQHGTALLAEADRRLYVAKKLGRDRVIADGRSSIAVAAAE
jgi:diguanylate cyclase (GGDEF) domain